MYDLTGKQVLVIGLGVSGRSAAALLLRRGAAVHAVDAADNPALRQQLEPLIAQGARVQLGRMVCPAHPLDLAVISPGIATSIPLVAELQRREVPLIGELELASLGPFIELLPQAKKEEIREHMTKLYFGKEVEEHQNSPAIDSKDLKDVMLELIKVIKK